MNRSPGIIVSQPSVSWNGFTSTFVPQRHCKLRLFRPQRLASGVGNQLEVVEEIVLDSLSILGVASIFKNVYISPVSFPVDKDGSGRKSLVPCALGQKRIEITWGGPGEQAELGCVYLNMLYLSSSPTFFIEFAVVEFSHQPHERGLVRGQKILELAR